jgi:DNA polymerase-3 subunit alpha
MDNTDKLRVLLADAKLFGVRFQPPDINRGGFRFEPIDDRNVRYGLGAVKGTGQGAIEAIVAAREGAGGQGGGPFRSLFDFCARVDRRAVNKRAVEALVKAGAFDGIHPDRAALANSIGLAFDWAETQESNALQAGLFDFGDGDSHGSSREEPQLVHGEPWTLREKLMHEKTAIGFFLTGHLFDVNAEEVRRFVRTKVVDAQDSREPQLLAGIVSDLRVVNGQRGRAAIFMLDDGSERLEVVANEELLDAHRTLLADDELVVLSGRVQNDRFSGALRMQVHNVWNLSGARARFGRWLQVDVPEAMPPVAEVLKLWPAQREDTEHGALVRGLAVRLRVQRQRGGLRAEGVIDLGDEGRFWPTDEALARWRSLAPRGQAIVVYE